eukprot:6116720-Ditylum_brightwellii.AAC.1
MKEGEGSGGVDDDDDDGTVWNEKEINHGYDCKHQYRKRGMNSGGTQKTSFSFPQGSIKPALNWSFQPSKYISAVSAINMARSPLIATGCSDKSLHILDCASSGGSEMWSVPNAAGTRAAHSIAFPN